MNLHATVALLQLAAVFIAWPMATVDAQPTEAPTSCYQQTTGVVISTEGGIPLPEDAIEIFAWHGDTVEFELKQMWKTGQVTWIGFEYDFCEVGIVCDTKINFGQSRGLTFDGNCDETGFLEAILYVHEATWSDDVYVPLPPEHQSSKCRYVDERCDSVS